ncbi:unnamed protein product [Lasius platythorax]|uniref:Uncharacterized protein n=1 Tax=Lasius platythorax TaxID=488582 RepID=A0AAV2NU95_9HYME
MLKHSILLSQQRRGNCSGPTTVDFTMPELEVTRTRSPCAIPESLRSKTLLETKVSGAVAATEVSVTFLLIPR